MSWFKIENMEDCRKYLKNYTKRKVKLVVEYLLDKYDPCSDIYSMMYNYGYTFDKYQRLALISKAMDLDIKKLDK